MEKNIWDELYPKAEEIICKLCKQRVSYYDACCDYIRDRLISNDFQDLKNYDSSKGASISTYLYKLVHSRFLDFVNSAKNRKEREFIDEHIDYKAHTNSFDDSILTQLSIEEAFKKANLTNEQITLLKMKYQDGYKYSELASFFNLKETTVKKRVENSIKKLRDTLKKLGIDLEDII